jgi:transposase InsO family protein
MLIDEPELHREADPKMSAAFFRMSRSIRSRSFSRRSRATSEAYRQALARSGITPSMSRKGDCWDNAPMESFFHTLKTERVHHCARPCSLRRALLRESGQRQLLRKPILSQTGRKRP